MRDLIDFLRARLDEDERAIIRARKDAVYEHEWSYELEAEIRKENGEEAEPEGIDRPLVDIDAKRRIVDECGPMACGDVTDPGEEAVAAHVLRCLALPYATRPDYREDWRP